jgi:beta-glucanase (GH16 family)
MGVNLKEVRWPACGEIDIMEYIGREPDWIHANAHYAIDGKHQSGKGKLQTEKPYLDFHIFALEWYPDRFDYFFDDIKYHTFHLDKAGTGDDNPFRKPQFLLINLALGGSWGGAIDDAMLPQQYLIDYVRVYQEKQ